MKRIYSLSQEYGFQIIEDASHAIGGKYQEGQIGNCHYSDITVFSFHPVKIITSGEGGMAMTNNGTLMSKLQHMDFLGGEPRDFFRVFSPSAKLHSFYTIL